MSEKSFYNNHEPKGRVAEASDRMNCFSYFSFICFMAAGRQDTGSWQNVSPAGGSMSRKSEPPVRIRAF